ncbi:hypothetical protein PBI_TWEETY_70 [Mycobacterium phage Tweety]|uniref:Uncharacterized protein n=2 Tax=Cheoctovirus TaxID=1623281 RepID=A0A386KRF9_9CAUD|nr:hypothetical protein PBI_TWEETY_70 [Mycobacterium phage Tweety]YP_009954550.1 hypothetical protein I5H13_gp071 [Mycobacterium phage ArcusAngelus]ABQ86139.1 hypothetical protein PBI_TWEETY_70 [Mycobacterium phage Tweety]AYD87820.1 hypothetical protein SEA_ARCUSANGELUS_72 [Mycobacterium phage ArcusAngelus]
MSDAQKLIADVLRRHRRTLNLETGRSHCQGARLGECYFGDGSLDDFEAHVAAEIDKALGGLAHHADPDTVRLLHAAGTWIAGAVADDPSGEPWLMTRTLLNEIISRVDELGGWPHD